LDNVRERYLRWLCGLVGLHNRRGLSYWILARKLFQTPYVVRIGSDRDREYDGCNLRYIFSHECCPGTPDRITNMLEGPCSVLEMLVAFSMRIDDWLNGGDEKERQRWFFQMLRNLKLVEYNDGACSSMDGRDFAEHVEMKLDIWMEGRYRWNGEGGIFPLRMADQDQRKVDLWYQLQGYLRENYRLVGEDLE